MNKLLASGLLALCAACAQKAPAPAPSAAAATGDSTVVAQIGTEKVTLGELDRSAAAELYEARQKALENLVLERAIAPLAKQAGLSPEELVRKQVEAKVPEVSATEAQAFFDANKERMGPQFAGKTFADVKNEVVQGLTGQKRQAAVGEVLEELKQKAGVKTMLAPPKIEVAATGPAKGPADAKVTIVEFSDFQCPFCTRGRTTMDEVVKAYGNKVRLVFRDFPLSFHEHAAKAAEAGQCADEQGKFWAMHDWMFDHQDQLAADGLKKGAKEIGLDQAKFDLCLTSGRQAEKVAASLRDGQKAGVRGTPAFFVNGVFLSGALPFEKFKAEIDRALAATP